MARKQITIEALSPLSLGALKGYGGTLIESGQYITGAHLRGALGALLLEQMDEGAGREGETLTRAMPEETLSVIDRLLGASQLTGLHFPNCYPSKTGRAAQPLPQTAMSCKRQSGFLNDEEPGHGVFDTLLEQLAYERLNEQAGSRAIPLPYRRVCLQCGGRAEPLAKAFSERLGKRQYRKSRSSMHRQTRVAINRARQTAEDSLLYSVQAVDEGEKFCGVMEVDEARVGLLTEALADVERIGGRSSRGFGRVRVTLADAESRATMRERIKIFDEQYRATEAALLTLTDNLPTPAPRRLFTISLHADAVLRSATGLPTLRLDAEMLMRALKKQLADGEVFAVESLQLTLVAQFSQARRVSGWQTAWNLPKEVLLAVEKGSLYVFAAHTADESSLDWLCRLLERLEAVGIGELREDGFGQLVVCDPFHLEVEPV